MTTFFDHCSVFSPYGGMQALGHVMLRRVIHLVLLLNVVSMFIKLAATKVLNKLSYYEPMAIAITNQV